MSRASVPTDPARINRTDSTMARDVVNMVGAIIPAGDHFKMHDANEECTEHKAHAQPHGALPALPRRSTRAGIARVGARRFAGSLARSERCRGPVSCWIW